MDNEALNVIIHYLGVAFGRAFLYKSNANSVSQYP